MLTILQGVRFWRSTAATRLKNSALNTDYYRHCCSSFRTRDSTRNGRRRSGNAQLAATCPRYHYPLYTSERVKNITSHIILFGTLGTWQLLSEKQVSQRTVQVVPWRDPRTFRHNARSWFIIDWRSRGDVLSQSCRTGVVDRVARVKFRRWWTQCIHSRPRVSLWICKMDAHAHAHTHALAHAHAHAHAHKRTNKQTNTQTNTRTYTHVQAHEHEYERELEHARTPVSARKYTISTQVCGGVAAGGLALRAVALWLPLRTCHWKWRTRRRVPPPCATSNWVGTSPSDPPSPLLSRPTFCFSVIHAVRPKSRRTLIADVTRVTCVPRVERELRFCRPFAVHTAD